MGNILIHPLDNVEVSPENGHKYAIRAIRAGEPVVKYGFPIGVAVRDIGAGEWVHTHNLGSRIPDSLEYRYRPAQTEAKPEKPAVISAYVRKNGRIGIRNDVWVIPAVACVNKSAERIAALTGALCFPHPCGCSQLGDDLLRTQKILRGLILHPNAGGVLVLGLGCENNRPEDLRASLGDYDPARVRFLTAQDCGDEIAEGVRLVNELLALASSDRREPVPVSRLVVGLKCGGSDGLSGITANPAVGRVADRLTAMGGACVLTEVPEMFGAEQLLMDRCVSETVFRQTADLINGFKRYFLSHGQTVDENPSPGNREGGITTLEEKSLGCVQKGGRAPVTAVLDYGDTVTGSGLNLLNGPGNDPVAVTNLTAAGCQLILFTTGRGTPLGAPVPTLKIATNTALAEKKRGWIDFDAQKDPADALFGLLLETANGRPAKNELNGCREISIFRDGVTL